MTNAQHTLCQQPIIVLLRNDFSETTLGTATKAIHAGFRNLEIAFTVPQAERISMQLKWKYPHITIWAGAISSIEDAKKAIHAGADFLVGSHFNREVSIYCKERFKQYIPEALTLSDIHTIKEAGISILKITMSDPVGRLAYIRNIKRLFPDLEIIVTGDFTIEDIRKCLNSGVLGIGVEAENCAHMTQEAFDWREIKSGNQCGMQMIERNS